MMQSRNIFHVARTVHAYAGIVLCLIVMIFSLSGALLVFKEDYVRLTEPAARAAPDLSPAGLEIIAKEAERVFGEKDISAIVFATPDFALHKVYLLDGRSAYLGSDGAVIDEWSANGRVEEWIFDLHHRLLAGEIGRWIAGLSAISVTILIVTGLFAYWPARRGMRRGLRITSMRRLDVLSLHRNLGVLIAPLLLLTTVTGVFLSFPSSSRAIFDVFGAAPVSGPPNVERGQGDDIEWQAGLWEAAVAFPSAAPRIAIWPRSDAPPSIRVRQPSEWHPNGRTVVAFEPETGRAIFIRDATNAGSGREAFNAIYPLHAASIGGRVYDAVMFLAGLGMFCLAGFGAFAFSKRLSS